MRAKPPVYVVDVIGEVVDAVSAEILTTIQDNQREIFDGKTDIVSIDYQYGHRLELIETLSQMSQSKTEKYHKYPLVYLVQDFPEDLGRAPGIYADVVLTIIVAHGTQQGSKITKRMEQVFKPVLYPIFQELCTQLFKHPQIHVQSPSSIQMRKWDRSRWGRVEVSTGNTANKLSDFVDAIELEQLRLKIKYPSACPPQAPNSI